jgi:hypothetical protein
LKSQKFSLKLLLEAKEDGIFNLTDSLQLQITPSDIMIATTQQNDRIGGGNLKRSVKVMKVKIAKM